MMHVTAKREHYFKKQYFCDDVSSFWGDSMTLRLAFYNSALGIGILNLNLLQLKDLDVNHNY